MPSFDIESKVDNHELSNAIDQTNRLISNRYDLKDANAQVSYQESEIKISANESFQLEQIIPILKENLTKRSIDLKSIKIGEIHQTNNASQVNIDLIPVSYTHLTLPTRLPV